MWFYHVGKYRMFEWYWVFLFYLGILHLKVVVVSIYLHRGVCHNLLEFSSGIEKVFKFLMWTLALYFKDYKQVYRAQHLKHHVHSDSSLDPHTPYFYTFWELVEYPSNEKNKPFYTSDEDIKKFSRNLQTDHSQWLDRNLYLPHDMRGWYIWYPIILVLYGPIALAISFIILPFWVKNLYQILGVYFYHKFGYVSKAGNRGDDRSRNILPWGILLCGEELHNNHHVYVRDPKFSHEWFEWDQGWLYIKILELFGLVQVNRTTYK